MKVVFLRTFVNYKLLLTTQGMLIKLKEYLLMEQSGMM